MNQFNINERVEVVSFFFNSFYGVFYRVLNIFFLIVID